MPVQFLSHFLLSVLLALPLFATSLSLDEGIELLKKENLEIKLSHLDQQSTHYNTKISEGYSYGSLTLTQDASRSNDPLNVFGFKLTSKEASFKDFGLAQYTGAASVEPRDLNYPDAQSFFQTKLTYTLPLYTGGKLSNYEEIAKKIEELKQLDHKNLLSEKIYHLRKSYYSMALIETSIQHLTIIQNTVVKLQTKTLKMVDEGYAKKVDLLEINAKKANIDRMLQELEGNKKVLNHFIRFLLNTDIVTISLPSEENAQPKLPNTIASNNTDVQKALKGIDIQNKMVNVALSSYYPTLGVSTEIASADDRFLNDFKDHSVYTLGARLTWNLYNGGIDSARYEQSKVEQLKAMTQLDLAKKGYELQVEQLKTQIEQFELQIITLEQELLLAKEITKNYEARYQEHLSPISDLLIKQSEQIEKILELQHVKNLRNERVFALDKLQNGEEL